MLLSSHIIADLERVCDYLIILAASRVQLAGDIAALVGQHKVLIGPRAETEAVARDRTVIQARHTGPQATLLVHATAHAAVAPPSWTVHDVPLEELVLAYLGQQRQDSLASCRGEEVPA